MVGGLASALPAWGQQKPFTQAQVTNMVAAGLGDDSGTKLIEERGIDFRPSEDYLQRLHASGAGEAFLTALRSANPVAPETPKPPLNQVQVFGLIGNALPPHRLAFLIRQRGLDFEPNDEYIREIRAAGGDAELVAALKSAKVTRPTNVDPKAEANRTEVRRHLARALADFKEKDFVAAETECRLALKLDPQNADLHRSLGVTLAYQHKWDESIAEFREAVSLDPTNALAHRDLGMALGGKNDWDGMIEEERAALRLDPNYVDAHISLGYALAKKGDRAGAIAEYLEVLRIEPTNAEARSELEKNLLHPNQ